MKAREFNSTLYPNNCPLFCFRFFCLCASCGVLHATLGDAIGLQNREFHVGHFMWGTSCGRANYARGPSARLADARRPPAHSLRPPWRPLHISTLHCVTHIQLHIRETTGITFTLSAITRFTVWGRGRKRGRGRGSCVPTGGSAVVIDGGGFVGVVGVVAAVALGGTGWGLFGGGRACGFPSPLGFRANAKRLRACAPSKRAGRYP